MDIVSRVQNILLKPKDEWVKIKGESTPPMQLIMTYALFLAAIPAVALLIGSAINGYGYGVKLQFASALFYAIALFVVSLAATYAFGIIINALAPNFGGKPNLQKAMQLAVYSMTPVWIAGILNIIPSLAMLGSLLGLYGLFILYLGFNTPLMDTPKDKQMTHLIVSIVCMVVLQLIVYYVLRAIFLSGAHLSVGNFKF